MLGCYVGAASENDRDGVKLDNVRKKYTEVKKMWANMGYRGENLKI